MKAQSALPLALVYALGIAVLSVLTFWDHFPQRDFAAFYLSISDYWKTGSLYAPHVNQNLNPPHVSVILFSPFILLPMAPSAITWFLSSVAMTGWSLALIRYELQLSTAHTCWLAAAVFASSASQHNLDQGQLGAPLMLLSTLAWRSARRNRSAAAWLALAISIKPPLGLLVFAQHRKDAMRTIAMCGVALVLGVLLIGPDHWRSWFAAMNANRHAPVPSNLSVFGVLIRASWSIAGEMSSRWLVIFWAVASAGIAAVTLHTRRSGVDQAWLLWGLTAVLISPIGWTYYLLILSGPLAAWGQQQGWPNAIKTPLMLLMVPTQVVFLLWVLHPMLGSVYSAAALFLWAVVIYRSRRAPAAAHGYAATLA